MQTDNSAISANAIRDPSPPQAARSEGDPDYFYGKDGIANDWSPASGTSMAAPYIAGASVLVREAMEMVGIQDVSAQSIYEHLKSTANSVWDSVTKQNYQSLDLDRAIESLLPIDTVGDSFATGMNSQIQNTWQTDGWINSLSDQDVYRLAPSQSGTIWVQIGSDYVDDAVFKLFRDGQETALQASQGKLSFSVSAGETVGLGLTDPGFHWFLSIELELRSQLRRRR